MRSMIRHINDHGVEYDALAFICPGCELMWEHASGLHMLPVNSTTKTPSWTWDGNLDAPTLGPSILTSGNDPAHRCHSFLVAGVFQFLGDCSHVLAGTNVPLPDLPEWFTNR